jgi:aminopeptidase YwaD
MTTTTVRTWKRVAWVATGLAWALAACVETKTSEAPSRPIDIREDLMTLTAPEMEGRGAGTLGQIKAGEYLAHRFADIGLVPIVGGDAGYLQPFEQPASIEVYPASRLSIAGSAKQLSTDFMPLPFSEDGAAELPIVFAGYGISAADLHYDDYAGINVKDRAVLVFNHEPRERDEHSPFRAADAFRYRTLIYKAINAREHGAKAVLIANDGLRHPDLADKPPRPGGDEASPAGILALSITEAVASTLLRSDARTIEHVLDEAMTPQSRVLEGSASVGVKLNRKKTLAFNVVGAVRGTDPKLSAEAIVIGAHYDHLGYGGIFSLTPDEKKIHPGADDNASGVSAVLAMAQHFRAAPLRRTLVFIAFSGEELGILGSSYYAEHPAMPLTNTIAMVNLDMVGRLRDDKVIVQGTATSPGFEALLRKSAEASGLVLSLKGDGYGPSDHTSFYKNDIPVLFFFTGVHDDYHKPSDTPDKINFAGIARVASLVESVVSAIDTGDERPQVVRAPAPPAAGTGNRGYGAYLGTIPDFGEAPAAGVLLAGVRPGSPAEKAGIQKGDVLVHLGTMDIRNLEDMTYALREHRAGDTVELVVVRAGQKLTVKATLGERH